jgi:hypothetical protein
VPLRRTLEQVTSGAGACRTTRSAADVDAVADCRVYAARVTVWRAGV